MKVYVVDHIDFDGGRRGRSWGMSLFADVEDAKRHIEEMKESIKKRWDDGRRHFRGQDRPECVWKETGLLPELPRWSLAWTNNYGSPAIVFYEQELK